MPKFDVIAMNPPYQSLKSGNTKSQAIWDKFVVKAIDSIVEEGYLVAVHPDGWRSITDGFKDVRIKLKSKQLLYLEIHNTDDGYKTFGTYTTYDFYCLHNVPCSFNTKIKCVDGTIEEVDISKMDFIPNGRFDDFRKLIAKENEERVTLISDSSYHTQRTDQMSPIKTEVFKYPVVYVTYKDGSINFWYSNVNNKGHYGISKVIWSNGGASTPIIDIHGEYGITQYTRAIVDDVDNLPSIQKAMLNPEFMELMSFSDGTTGKGRHRYNFRAISTFRKDFWKEFI